MAEKSFSVIFVCFGNICRSPAAENVLRHQASQAGLGDLIHIDSAGTDTWDPGAPPDRRMTRALHKRAIPSTGAARRFNAGDYLRFDLILAMDSENHAKLLQLAPTEELQHKVRMFTTFYPQPGYDEAGVPDPYYGGNAGFELVADMLEDGCRQLLDYLRIQIT